jgi:aminopeptidase N
VLHLLRTELGAPVFWQGIKQYLQTHAHGNSLTSDLQSALERASSTSLDRFFDQWLLRPSHPSLKVRASYEAGRVTVRFDQTQSDVFELTYEVVICDGAGKLHTLLATTADKHFELSLELKARPTYVAVDPNLRLLGSVQLETSFDWATQQLKKATSARLRRQAATWLGTRHDFRAVAALSATLTSKQEHASVRVACATSLGRLRSKEAFEALRNATRSPEPRARAAIAEALGDFRSSAALDALKAMLKGEKSYLVEAAVTRALGAVRQDNVFPLLAKQSQHPSWADVVASAALDAVAQSGESQALPLIIEATKPSATLRKRRAAAAALGKLGDVGNARRRLTELLEDPNPLLRTDAVLALYNLGGDAARSALRARQGRETDGRVTRRIREVLLKADAGDDQRQVRERLLKMEREVEEVKSQLASLKAKHKG